MGERIVHFNGSRVLESQVQIGIFDSLFTSGVKGVEVTRTFNHRPYRLDAHIQRLYQGLSALRIRPGYTQEEMQEATEKTLEANLPLEKAYVDWQIMHYVSPGPATHFEIVPEDECKPTIIIHCIPLLNRIGKMAGKYTNGVDLVTVDQRAIPQDILPGQIKSTGRMDHIIGRFQAKEIKSGSTGVLLDSHGYVTEGTGSSLFLVKKGVIVTAPSSIVLNGITRELIFSLADGLHIPIEERFFTPEEAKDADEIFITSTVICLVHAPRYDEHTIGTGAIGPTTLAVRKAFIEEVSLDFVQQANEYARILTESGPVR